MVHTKHYARGNWGAINCKEGFGTLKMVPISSNHLFPFKNSTVYAMSKYDSNSELKTPEFTGINSQQFSEVTYVPKSELDFSELLSHLNSLDVKLPTRNRINLVTCDH